MRLRLARLILDRLLADWSVWLKALVKRNGSRTVFRAEQSFSVMKTHGE
jgi:hypothetical protein